MTSFFCYIHSIGVQTPQLRLIDADDEGQIIDQVSEDMKHLADPGQDRAGRCL